MSNEKVTVLTDENGVLREYREVKRKANVGERIKIVAADVQSERPYENGDTFVVDEEVKGFEGDVITQCGRYIEADEYVVLEPTDIVIVDGVRYREEKREARKGERVMATRKDSPFYSFGQVGIALGPEYVEFPHAKLCCYPENYVVLTPVSNEPKPKQSPTPDVFNVTINVTVNGSIDDAIKAATEALKAKLADFNPEKAIRELITQPAPKSPQQHRDEIIEKAKRDVAELLDANHQHLSPPVYFTRRGGFFVTDRVEFVVNREKRTVVALVRELGENHVIHRGIAKCAPNDCFNVHIGKAIALRRALGLPVPDEYLNAPQPTEVRVGDIVNGGLLFGAYTPDETFTITAERGDNSFKYAECPSDWIYRHQIGRIIDDSREQTEVSA
ncbi:hypothetical protein [Brevibacillus sp. SYP-B805]|uniref:hypothetical protein n=1 Tax=Brevibacillus sp. SYP-B805 TaxID=1578199 RepID=UPI0019D06EB8|nr:hypothetical protein [Brevibacillus sp. SYP-B805]